uniref:Uncharacterized protein TCIL3000_11_10050 n=1 Tax=Trypanosoma congolense (strain IL3000) TaxID=1068625 RepID=G0V1L2_TRYCI|nr:unnamed protein product [Trypanosoma congolense IL3000]
MPSRAYLVPFSSRLRFLFSFSILCLLLSFLWPLVSNYHCHRCCIPMSFVLLLLAVLLMLAVVVVVGAVYIAVGGFIQMSCGGLIISTGLSLGFSVFSMVMLEMCGGVLNDFFPEVLTKAILTAASEQTVSGVALLAILVVVSASASRLCGILEDIQILLDTHKGFVDESESEGISH